MNNDSGICLTCGYMTAIARFGSRSRMCPNGHGELKQIRSKYVKLISKKGDTGKDRLRKYHILKSQFREHAEFVSFEAAKRIGTGRGVSVFEKWFYPHKRIK